MATFSLKALLRLVPVAFGAGVICGTIMMGYACYIAFAAEELSKAAGLDVFTMLGPHVTVHTAHTCLVCSAALPLVAYLVFLVYCLGIEVLRAFLILPGKIDQLAARDEEKHSVP